MAVGQKEHEGQPQRLKNAKSPRIECFNASGLPSRTTMQKAYIEASEAPQEPPTDEGVLSGALHISTLRKPPARSCQLRLDA